MIYVDDDDYKVGDNSNDNDGTKTAELCLMQMTSTSIFTLVSAALFVHSKLISLSQNTIFLV